MTSHKRQHEWFFLFAALVPAVGGVGSFLAIATIAESTQIALITAGPPTLAAIFAAILGWLNHTQGQKIHVLVNSNMSAVKTDLALANARIEKLQTLVNDMTLRKADTHEDLMAPIPPTIPEKL